MISIYFLLHEMYRPLRDYGIIKMVQGVKYNKFDENITIDLTDYLKDINYKEVNNILITEKGIFSLFFVCFDGTVYGNNPGSKWIQRTNHQQIFIPNPIKFNEDKINELENKLNLGVKINNLVVFVNNNAENVRSDKAINLNKLTEYLNNFKSDIKLDANQMEDIYKKLKNE